MVFLPWFPYTAALDTRHRPDAASEGVSLQMCHVLEMVFLPWFPYTAALDTRHRPDAASGCPGYVIYNQRGWRDTYVGSRGDCE